MKFHAFFRKVIIKGGVLGKVDHFYWKKEYQNRGAPHYHVLIWIRDAPVIDRDEPENILEWIQKRITCHIPDKDGSPELHRLVTRYHCINAVNTVRDVKGVVSIPSLLSVGLAFLVQFLRMQQLILCKKA